MEDLELESRRPHTTPLEDAASVHHDSPGTSASKPRPQGIRLILITVGLIMSIFLAALDQSIVATAIPSITDEFNALDEIAWYGGVYFLTIGVFSSFWGIRAAARLWCLC